ncbi:uncharacterized protein KY384_004402 [Bacidia gigantensis]|uniref:uncharacterized protein n=1 Tax=Bacidia gigantensis TaxID=2732470 RepID=UPI001D03D6CC|nr:uncharacterized protein KY384_004402 [Bacidia gigantensis]KAG8531045.1 hypothetical protein KY384_004402 [Bacidia gigantensis]
MAAMNVLLSTNEQAERSENAFKARNYQLEMLEESLQQNIIAAMPTGSGKTLIAVLRAHLDRPKVLGLTATPSNRIENLGDIESNLNAISRTPKLHQEELGQHVHQPTLLKLTFARASGLFLPSKALESLERVFLSLNIHEDPWIIRMKAISDDFRSRSKLSNALLNNSTRSHQQIKKLLNRTRIVDAELGPYASALYLSKCAAKYLVAKDEVYAALESLDEDERNYVKNKLGQLQLPNVEELSITEQSSFTPKLQALIDFLTTEQATGFTGLIFAKTRAEVSIISHILTLHPMTRKFVTKSFVGSSSYAGRKLDVAELMVAQDQKHTLEDLRKGDANLIVTTDALEEGIDVISCNVVICFEKPLNLRSFVQRRGRARDPTSRYVLLLERSADLDISDEWRSMEIEFGEVYHDRQRQVINAEEVEEEDTRVLLVETTGESAQIKPIDATAHLAHFCDTSTTDAFTDPSPTYTYDDSSSDPKRKAILATVLLPNTVDADIRVARGSCRWTQEKYARRDAAFEAYRALYHAGLVNDNLLPSHTLDPEVEAALSRVEIRPNVAKVAGEISMWPHIAREWHHDDTLSVSRVSVCNAENNLQMFMFLPVRAPAVNEFSIYWDVNTTFSVCFEPNIGQVSTEIKALARASTSMLLQSIFRSKMTPNRKDLPVLFSPFDSPDSMRSWLALSNGSVPAADAQSVNVVEQLGLVRDIFRNGLPHVLQDVKYAMKEDLLRIPAFIKRYPDFDAESDKYHMVLEVCRLSKRTDLLHASSLARKKPAIDWLLSSSCEIDRLPLQYAQFASLIPSMLHKIHAAFIVENLMSSLLSPIVCTNRQLIATAITASSAGESTDYQRLEFLGDSLLKLQTSLALMAKHLRYYENILTRMKEHIISNTNLARAALSTGLDQYIFTKIFTGSKWRPFFNEDLLAQPLPKVREMSTKILADVVEALIGAAYLEGGFENALRCTKVFLPEAPWDAYSDAFHIFHNLYSSRPSTHAYVDRTEQLIQHKFGLKSLVDEAITHVSYQSPGVIAPYERLEFIGDACLDIIVTVLAHDHEPPLPVGRLHLVRSAMVNADFLGFLCLRHSIDISRRNPSTGDPQNITTIEEMVPFYLWQILRHASPTIREAQKACISRLQKLEESILRELEHGKRHPWTLLARLGPPKPLSDLVESLLGAIYIDSRGSLAECTKFLEHIGLMTYLRRVLSSDNALLHPKEELGRLSDQDDVRYVMDKRDDAGGKKWLMCAVIVGEREIAKIEDGFWLIETQTRAADLACEALRRERPDRYKTIQDGWVGDARRDDVVDENEIVQSDSDGGVVLENNREPAMDCEDSYDAKADDCDT